MSEEIKKIEDLPGVGEATAEKLSESGYGTLEAVAAATNSNLEEKADLGKKTARKIINAARESLEIGYETASELMEKRKNVTNISTGSEELDNLLGGGVETQAITEVYGSNASGKTQLCLKTAVNVQKPIEDGGLGRGALYIDTEKTFRPKRVKEIVENSEDEMDPEEVLDRIQVAQAFSSDHQILLLDEAPKIIKENDIGLIIIDSLTGKFRSEYAGRGRLADRQQKLNKHLHKIQEIADVHNLAVLVTNQVMSNPGLMFGDPTTPIGGNIVGHQSTTRLYIRKGKKNKRIARLVDSPSLPEGEAVFQISAKGIEDK